jgi:hypothetical protein
VAVWNNQVDGRRFCPSQRAGAGDRTSRGVSTSTTSARRRNLAHQRTSAGNGASGGIAGWRHDRGHQCT